MPPHVALFDEAGDEIDELNPIVITVEGGEESDGEIIDVINDRDDAFVDTTTAQDVRLKLIASIAGAPYVDSGTALLDERWPRVRILGKIVDGVVTTEGASDTRPFGVNATLPVGDMAPQNGWRLELKLVPPGGRTAEAVKLGIVVDDDASSAPLAFRTALATGSGVVPADRIEGLRAFLRGSDVTADDSDTITVAGGAMVYEGLITTFPGEVVVFDLEDGEAVDLGVGESYLVTLSRQSDGDLVVTKGPKDEALVYPDVPTGEVFVERLTVTSADGVAVTVSAASFTGGRVYAEYHARAGAGLTVIVSAGAGVTSPSDHDQFLSHEITVGIAATATSRIWRLADGSLIDTLTDVPPEFGADLLWLVTTDGAGVTDIVDARVFTHRAVTFWPVELQYRAVFADLASLPLHGVAAALVPFDGEIELITEALSDVDPGWTGGGIKIDLRVFPPGVPVPWPVGGAGTGGVSLFTSSGTDDQRPSIAFDATNLRAVTKAHEVRRVLADSWILLSIVETVAGPGGEPEQELRVRLNMRRYR